MRLSAATLSFFACAFLAWADPPTLVIEPEIRPAGTYVRMTPKTDAVSVTYIGLSGIDPFPSEELKDGRRFLLNVRGLPEGRYLFAAVGAGKNGEQTRTDFTVVIGVNPPPVPPGPNPPVPPGPTPPGPAPIPESGLRVLIIEETKERGKLPSAVKEIITGKTLRDLWESKLAKESDGGPARRIWDKDQAGVENDPDAKVWATAFRRPRASLPWVVISNGKAGYEGPLPDGVKFMELLKKFEGQ